MCKDLLFRLYEISLKDDPKFHFFYEPEIIIRFSSVECLEKAKTYLNERKIHFDVYSYPIPEKIENQLVEEKKEDDSESKRERKVHRFGEHNSPIVLKHLDLFVTIFHAHSVAAITMDDSDHFEYMERTIHTMFNPRAYTRNEEGKHLAELASFKL